MKISVIGAGSFGSALTLVASRCNNEVMLWAHEQQVVDAVNTTLLPNAKNPELKALIEKVTPAFQAHLDHAKKLQTELASAGASK